METNLCKRAARAKWHDPSFQRSANPIIAELSKENPVLSGVELAGIAIGVEGPVKDLWHRNLHRAHVSDSDLRFAELSCSLGESILERSLFSGAKFDRCIINRARISECDFTNTHLIVNLNDSIFEACRFIDAKFSGGKQGHEYGGRRVKFLGCDFTAAEFKGVEFRASRFIGCSFKNARFIRCDLRGVKVQGGTAPLASQFDRMEVPPWALHDSDAPTTDSIG